MPDPADVTAAVKELALASGFARAGIAPAGPVAGQDEFRQWLAAGRHGEMGYLARNGEKRFHPRRLVPGARSVICLVVGYAPEEITGAPDEPPDQPASVLTTLARYARGRDYHRVLKERCRRLMAGIRRIAPGFVGRAFVDSAPVAERSLAVAAGLGWIGLNRCLTVAGLGSYVCLGEIVCNLALVPDAPAEGRCSRCGACIRACPTGALGPDGLDARRCISYLTLEHGGPIDRQFWPRIGRRLIGCDACQEACPHNRNVAAGDAELIRPGELARAALPEVLGWDSSDWDRATRGSAARRASHDMLLRSAILAAGNSAGRQEVPQLVRALRRLGTRRADFRPMIDWAICRLGEPPAIAG